MKHTSHPEEAITLTGNILFHSNRIELVMSLVGILTQIIGELGTIWQPITFIAIKIDSLADLALDHPTHHDPTRQIHDVVVQFPFALQRLEVPEHSYPYWTL
jgi:hypothetical protein